MRPNLRIAQRLSRPLLYTKTISHIKHYRGYGIHSPFAYSLVRNVFMKRRLLGCDTELYDVLRSNRISERRSVQIQNLYDYCNYNGYSVDNFATDCITANRLLVATKAIEPDMLERLPSLIGSTEVTLCILYPKTDTARNKACRRLIKAHGGMSIDSMGFILLFYNDNRVKQHINL